MPMRKEPPSIHDNDVVSYKLLLPERTLVMETVFESREKTDIIFRETLAYSFENAGSQNVLFEVAETSVTSFVRWYGENAERQAAFEYGFPLKFIKDSDALLAYLKQNDYCYYEVNASVGLDGFVLAKSMEIVPRLDGGESYG